MSKKFALLAALLLAGCADTCSYKQITSIYQLNAPIYKVGGSRDTHSYEVACKRFSIATLVPYSSMLQIIPALETEKIDAAVFDRPALDYAAAQYGTLTVLPEELDKGHVAIAAPKANAPLVQKVNEFIAQYRADGTYERMYEYWVKTPYSKMPSLPVPEHPVGTLKVATEAANIPMNYIDRHGDLVGFNIEFAQRLAYFLNMRLELSVRDYKDLYELAGTGTVDLCIASMDVTPDGGESVIFSDEYIDSPVAVLVRIEKDKKR